jgi:hypothetical protein
MEIAKEEKSRAPWLLRIVSWSAAVASFVAYAVHKGSLVDPPATPLDGTFLWASLGFLVLPFVRSVKIGKLLALEREVEKAKESVREVQQDMRQMTSTVVAGFSATSTAQAKVVINTGSFQGAAPPEARSAIPPSERRPAAVETRHSVAELKLLNTLWHFQVARSPNLDRMWTFRVENPPFEAAAFDSAVAKLLSQGLIEQRSEDQQVYLSKEGLRYCKENARAFPADTWFSPEPLNAANEKHLMGKVDELK